MLDVECSVRGCPETYVQKVKVQQKDNQRLFEPQHCDTTRMFGIQHYAGKVVYDTSDFLGKKCLRNKSISIACRLKFLVQ